MSAQWLCLRNVRRAEPYRVCGEQRSGKSGIGRATRIARFDPECTQFATGNAASVPVSPSVHGYGADWNQLYRVDFGPGVMLNNQLTTSEGKSEPLCGHNDPKLRHGCFLKE